MNELFYLVKSLVMLAAVIVLANYVLKYLSRYQSQRNQHIQIIEKLSVTKESAISLVKIGETFYLMSFASGKNEILKEFNLTEQVMFQTDLDDKQAVQQENQRHQTEKVQTVINYVKRTIGKRPE